MTSNMLLLSFFSMLLLGAKMANSSETGRYRWMGNGGHYSLVKPFTGTPIKSGQNIIASQKTPFGFRNINTRRRFMKINTVKITDPGEDITNDGAAKLQNTKPKLSLNVENIVRGKNSSTDTLIDLIHFIRDNSNANTKETKRQFPDNNRILDDSGERNTLFYEVPTVEQLPRNTVDISSARFWTLDDERVEQKSHSSADLGVYFGHNGRPQKSDRFDDVPTGRFLNIFQIYKFNNMECLTPSGITGQCIHLSQCNALKGTSSGTCAQGYGACCIFQYSCGDQTSANSSTFTNPGFPKPSQTRLACTLTINKAFNEVNQLRLDIQQMELMPPTNGTCSDDQFVVTGQNINSIIPILCGLNNGQQLYVDVGDSPGPFYLSVLTSQEATRLLQVRVTQLGPNDVQAPRGCLQYFVGKSGVVESFNYRSEGTLPAYRNPGYTNNLNYAICIERARGACSISYVSADVNGEFIFQISNYDSDGVPLLPPDQAGAEIFNCPDDYIIVNGIRLCGERLNDASLTEDFTVNSVVTDISSGPIILPFRTNGNLTGRGFRLSYQQNPCGMPD